MAVGYFYDPPSNQTLTEKWDGSRWISGSSAGEGDFGVLDAVSCTSPTSCMAVGYDTVSGNDQTLAESWNGSEWSILPTPNISGSLEAVSCSGISTCVAVGNYYDNGSGLQNTLIESWNGSTWSVVASPTPPPSMANPDLVGVSCIGSSNCQAVGYYSDALDAPQTLVESWTGGEWSISPSPSPGNGHGTQLLGVSCATASSCVAVGYHAAVPKPLIESWNGSTWSVVKSPNPTSAGTDLFGVSCKKANQCVAVGGYNPHPGSKEKTLVESWQGTSWYITPSPSPEGIGNPYPQPGLPELDGVSCSSSDNCIAVGHYLTHGKFRTLVETGS